ncbi:MAG: branched-chain amino acid ABC transporter permease [Kiloniellales bacterium]|nr:branched-chain amino acid ABC transporter permease [Kiloniellales bacterium]
MQLVLVYAYQILFAFSLFILISLGLAVIFGMMRVINLAQGEFIMLGAYGCTVITNAGSPLWLSIILSGLIVGVIGIVAERTVIRFLYGRVLDTLLATWGLSLLIVGVVTTVFGPQTESVPQTLGKVTVGDFAIATYSLLMIVIAFGLLAATYALWRYTKVGLVVRGTMQNPTMARAIGVNTERVYMLTFGFGAMLTGLAGAILVPLFGASPTMGVFYVAKAFITVISGGHLPLLGTLSASGLFGSIDGLVSYTTASVLGEIAVLVVAIVLLRLLPQGITGRLRQGL